MLISNHHRGSVKGVLEAMGNNREQMFVEKRAFRRFRLKEDVFAFGHISKKLGLIKDISSGGLAVEYIVLDERQLEERSFEIFDIFLIGGRFIVRDAPCRVVYDCRCPEKLFTMGFLDMRRMGIEFGRLSAEQLSRMKEFLKIYSIVPVMEAHSENEPEMEYFTL